MLCCASMCSSTGVSYHSPHTHSPHHKQHILQHALLSHFHSLTHSPLSHALTLSLPLSPPFTPPSHSSPPTITAPYPQTLSSLPHSPTSLSPRLEFLLTIPCSVYRMGRSKDDLDHLYQTEKEPLCSRSPCRPSLQDRFSGM